MHKKHHSHKGRVNRINTAENKFVLASASPRRKQLLEKIGLQFIVMASGAAEIILEGVEPQIIVQELALLKAADVAKQCHKAIVIAADTLVCIDGNVMGKPSDKANAYAMLRALSGRQHSVYTGICVFDSETGKSVCDYEKTQVVFRSLSDEEIHAYISTGEPFDKAGAYGIQELGMLLIEEIHGDYFNVVGLPICKLGLLLKNEFQIDLLQK